MIDKVAPFVLVILLSGWSGLRCETDVDECAAGLVTCGPGDCVNQDGGYTCRCAAGFCGINCALLDPCFQPAAAEGEAGAAAAAAAGGNGSRALGPCLHGAACEQRCTDVEDYECLCVDGWGGKNCSQHTVSAGSEGEGDNSSTVLIGVGAALLALALAGGGVGALAAQARRKRATRGTYSPSGQEYCNPRTEMMHNALKPPPEERLI